MKNLIKSFTLCIIVCLTIEANGQLPDQYWTDLVTEQPEGYVVDDNGDVHLYSAEALAWLISVTNGLNGQETDDFDDKTIYLEENIDLSAALWIPLAGKNTIIDGFKGRFDGKEHVIDGLTMTNGISNYWAMGLFGKTSEATLSNIILKNGYYEAQSQSNSEGGFLANKVHKSTIGHCFVECEMHIHEGMSPFVYLCDSSVIYNCLVHVPLYRSSGWVTAIPGIFAAMSSPTSHIYNCASIIEQMDWSEYCGLVGMFNAGIIENCYAYIHEILNFPGYGGGSGLGPRNGITGSNIGEVYNCYYNRIRNFDPAFSGYYMQLDDSPGEGDNFYNASPFVEEGRGHWKLTEEIAFALEGGMVTTNDLLDALNLKVEELENETLLSWCDTGMNFENQLLPVFCDFDVTNLAPIEALSADYYNDTIILTWAFPETYQPETENLSWSGEMSNQYGSFLHQNVYEDHAHRYDTLDLRNYVGWRVKSIGIIPLDSMVEYYAAVWIKEGNDFSLLYSEPLTDTIHFSENTHELNEDIYIDSDKEYLFGWRELCDPSLQGWSGFYNAVDDKGPFFDGKGNMSRVLYEGWHAWPHYANWCITTVLESPEGEVLTLSQKNEETLTGYRVYKDGQLMEEIGRRFQTYSFDNGYSIGETVTYSVTAMYGDAESEPVSVAFAYDGVNDFSDTGNVTINPNPSNGLVRIEGAIANEVKVYNNIGQLLKTVRNANEINLKGLAQGVYMLHITDENGAVATRKLVLE